MSTRNVPPPFFPYPPETYDQNYFSDVVRSFSIFIGQQRNPGESRSTKMTFTNLPSGNDSGLETGALFEVDGFVRISVSYDRITHEFRVNTRRNSGISHRRRFGYGSSSWCGYRETS